MGVINTMVSRPRLRIGTRGSALARWQAEWVAARLAEAGVDVELVPIVTRGDVQQQGPVESIGAQGVFTKEIQRALLENQVDLAVHSLKDLPTEPIAGLCLAAVPQRAPVCDALVSRDGTTLAQLPPSAVVGTGSLRRRAQLLYHRPDLQTREIRGNVDTRLGKVDAGDYDAIVPRSLPGEPRTYTYASGVAEFAIGTSLLVPRTRRLGGTAAAALFVAVFPANIKMAVDWIQNPKTTQVQKIGAIARLPLQIPLVVWALQVRNRTPKN